MGVFETSITLPRPKEEVFEFFRRSENLLRMFPDLAKPQLSLKIPKIMHQGGHLEFDVKTLGNHFHFVHEIVEVTQYERIKMRQIQGLFKEWIYEQHFIDTRSSETHLKTIIHFEPPGGMLGFVVTRKVIHSYLEKWFPRGHELIREELTNRPL